MYGWRGRIGLLVPSINTTMETEFWKIAPPGVSVHVARIAGGRHGTPEELRSMESAAKTSAEQIAMIEPDVVVYGCTSGSFFEGPEWNERICEELTKITGAPTVTTAGAMVAGLNQGGHKKVDIVTPYVDTTNARLIEFLRLNDISVGKLSTFDMLDMFDHAKIQPKEIYQKVKENITPDSEAVFISCTQLRALEVIDMLEQDIGKPVYSAVQASAWQAYQAMGITPEIATGGRLLRNLGNGKELNRDNR